MRWPCEQASRLARPSDPTVWSTHKWRPAQPLGAPPRLGGFLSSFCFFFFSKTFPLLLALLRPQAAPRGAGAEVTHRLGEAPREPWPAPESRP